MSSWLITHDEIQVKNKQFGSTEKFQNFIEIQNDVNQAEYKVMVLDKYEERESMQAHVK